MDKYAENIYRLRMRYFSKLGDNIMVLKTYKACRDRIETELNCALANETKALFHNLVAHPKSVSAFKRPSIV